MWKAGSKGQVLPQPQEAPAKKEMGEASDASGSTASEAENGIDQNFGHSARPDTSAILEASEAAIDSLDLALQDIDMEIDEGDWAVDDDFHQGYDGDFNEPLEDAIASSRLVRAERVRVRFIEAPSARDSLLDEIERRMRIHSPAPESELIVEWWHSPVRYRGYRFNRKKLEVFGISEHQGIQLFYTANEYFALIRGEAYLLEERHAYGDFIAVEDTDLVQRFATYAH